MNAQGSPAPGGTAADPGDAPEADPDCLRIDVFTIFPEIVEAYCSASILGRARARGNLDLRVHDLRSEASDPRRSVDDSPFGGGPGMVLAPAPVFAAVEEVNPPRPLFLLAPTGVLFDQSVAAALARGNAADVARASKVSRATAQTPSGPAAPCSFSLLCGRYEGVDQRIADHLVDGELSIGDVVLAGGELAALVVVEAVARLLPGVLGNESSATEESFTGGLLEYPQYTRPSTFRGWSVPEVLLSGDHRAVARWRLTRSLERTISARPDLIERRGGLTEAEKALLGKATQRSPHEVD